MIELYMLFDDKNNVYELNINKDNEVIYKVSTSDKEEFITDLMSAMTAILSEGRENSGNTSVD